MKRPFTLALVAAMALIARAEAVTDVISAETITVPETYEQQEASFNSDAVYLITLKDDGNGPQFKAGGSGIVTTVSGGLLSKVEVTWGNKSNEDVEVFGSHEPFEASNGEITGTSLGTIQFVASTAVSLDIDGEWEYVGITSTANKGKACAFASIAITWGDGTAAEDDPYEGWIINEICGDDGSGSNEDWVEIVNASDIALPIDGMKVIKIDEDGISEVLCTLSSSESLETGSYVIVTKGIDFEAGISNTKNVSIVLESPMGNTIDTFNKVIALTPNGNHYVGGSYSRIPDITGEWTSVANATKGAPNDPTLPEARYRNYKRIDSVDLLQDGLEFILVQEDNAYAMACSWGTTKDGNVYQLAVPVEIADGKTTIDLNQVAVCTLAGNDDGDGTWAIKFGETNNYLNDSRFLACKEFKSFGFKKNDDPTKGTRATVSFNAGGDAEISYGAEAGSIKFNLKDDGTSRFLNYDPNDKPDEHLAICIYVYDDGADIAIAPQQDGEAAVVYYNLQGMRVANPGAGIYIRRTGTSSQKVVIK